ncbi:MAG: hypothetical protein ACJA16_002891 [Akkermansiaceae bacterium]|jgi:hypothetical protein
MIRFGQPLTSKLPQLQHRRREGDLINDLMRDYGLSKASVYRYLGKVRDER